jgi:hypothetical protein
MYQSWARRARALLCFVDPAERGAGPHQQCLGGVQSAVQVPGDLGHRQPVEVAQRERGPVVGAEPVEHLAGADPVDDRLPRVLDARRLAVQQAQPALFALDPPPVVGELVPGHPDQPGDRRIGRIRLAGRVHGGQE